MNHFLGKYAHTLGIISPTDADRVAAAIQQQLSRSDMLRDLPIMLDAVRSALEASAKQWQQHQGVSAAEADAAAMDMNCLLQMSTQLVTVTMYLACPWAMNAACFNQIAPSALVTLELCHTVFHRVSSRLVKQPRPEAAGQDSTACSACWSC